MGCASSTPSEGHGRVPVAAHSVNPSCKECFGGSSLKEWTFTSQFKSTSCDACRKDVAKNSTVYGCRRCNYDECADCFRARNLLHALLKVAPTEVGTKEQANMSNGAQKEEAKGLVHEEGDSALRGREAARKFVEDEEARSRLVEEDTDKIFLCSLMSAAHWRASTAPKGEAAQLAAEEGADKDSVISFSSTACSWASTTCTANSSQYNGILARLGCSAEMGEDDRQRVH